MAEFHVPLIFLGDLMNQIPLDSGGDTLLCLHRFI